MLRRNFTYALAYIVFFCRKVMIIKEKSGFRPGAWQNERDSLPEAEPVCPSELMELSAAAAVATIVY
ncbi:hypothetical protein [Chitinimonas naiadis]